MRSLLIASLLTLSACGPAGPGGPGDDAEQNDTPAVDPAIAAFEADYAFPVTEVLVSGLTVPEGLSVAYEDGGTMTVSGISSETSPGNKTGGAAITINSDQEKAIGGNLITVRIVAKGDAGSVLAVSYSTNDAGNSGWRNFDMTDTFTEYTFTYKVPAVNRGRYDFLGLSPSGGAVTVGAIGLDVEEATPG